MEDGDAQVTGQFRDVFGMGAARCCEFAFELCACSANGIELALQVDVVGGDLVVVATQRGMRVRVDGEVGELASEPAAALTLEVINLHAERLDCSSLLFDLG
ncbi:MAG: hypothetical protein DLM61_07075 [Pseudonocardiales bacterium]|nr:MAG: hypothetical protein DLM61_07075 [Pseudonocardiales bacterium]